MIVQASQYGLEPQHIRLNKRSSDIMFGHQVAHLAKLIQQECK